MSMIEISDTNGHIEGVRFDLIHLECETMLAQANTLIKEQRSQNSVELLLKILQHNPKFGKAYNHLGWVYEIDYRDYTRAEEYYKKAMQYEPEYSASYTHYARLLASCKRFEELKAHLEMALTIPTVSEEVIYYEFDLMYEMQKNPEAAMDYYVKAAMTTLESDKVTLYQKSIKLCREKNRAKKITQLLLI
jgi:tetratricopeptide (TPR) repeat protein